jgi:hypothetical protein
LQVLAVHCALGEGQAALKEELADLELLAPTPSKAPTTVTLAVGLCVELELKLEEIKDEAELVDLKVLAPIPSPVPTTVPLAVELCVRLELEEVEDEEALAEVCDELELEDDEEEDEIAEVCNKFEPPRSIREVTVVVRV